MEKGGTTSGLQVAGSAAATRCTATIRTRRPVFMVYLLGGLGWTRPGSLSRTDAPRIRFATGHSGVAVAGADRSSVEPQPRNAQDGQLRCHLDPGPLRPRRNRRRTGRALGARRTDRRRYRPEATVSDLLPPTTESTGGTRRSPVRAVHRDKTGPGRSMSLKMPRGGFSPPAGQTRNARREVIVRRKRPLGGRMIGQGPGASHPGTGSQTPRNRGDHHGRSTQRG